MPLSGTFDTVPLSELLQWLGQTAKSGTLTVSVDMEETSLVLRDGDVIAVGSDDPLRLDLGQVLLANRRISQAQLDQVHQIHTKQGGSLDEALVLSGALTAEGLSELQAEHLFGVVLDLFFQQNGSFHFSPQGAAGGMLDELDEAQAVTLPRPISTQRILMESMRRVDEWTRIRQVFPNRFVVVHALVGPDATAPNATVGELASIGRPISVGELCLRRGGDRFSVFRELFEAYNLGLVGLDLSPTGKDSQAHLGPSQLLMENARLLMGEQQFDEAREVLATLANLEPDDPEVRALMASLREEQLAHLYQLIPPHRTPVLACSREALDDSGMSPRERYLASRLSGKLDVATLVVATPLSELETLRVLRKLMHAGIARLAD